MMTPRTEVPVFNLYGEHTPWPTPDMVHCESIASRSALHNWQIRPHRHAGLFQILYLQAGQACVQLDDRQQEMHGNQVLIVPQLCIHGFRFSEDAQGSVVTLAYPLIIQLSRQLGDSLIASTVPSLFELGVDDDSVGIGCAFDALDIEYRGVGKHRALLLEFLLGSLLIRLTRKASLVSSPVRMNAPKANVHFEKFSALVEEHYQRHYSVSHYAVLLGITPAHLNMVCRQVASHSALEMLHARVLLEAKRKLIYTSMTVSVIAYAIGFSDPAYFTRFFRRLVGVAPKDFRLKPPTGHDM